MEDSEGVIVNKLKRLSIRSPPNMSTTTSLILSDEEVSSILSVTSLVTSTLTFTPPIPTSSNAGGNNVSLVSTTGSTTKTSHTVTDSDNTGTTSEGNNSGSLFSTSNFALSPDASSPQPQKDTSAHSNETPLISPIESSTPTVRTLIPDPGQATRNIYQLSKSLPANVSVDDPDDDNKMERELDLVKNLLMTTCRKYDKLMDKIQADVYTMGNNLQNFVNSEVLGRVDRTEKKVEEFVNQKIQEFVNFKKEVEDTMVAAEKHSAPLVTQEVVDKQIKQLKDSLVARDFHSGQVVTQETMDERIKKLTEENVQLSKQLYNLDTRILECEQYSRRESIIISGIPNCVHQNELEDVVLNILVELGINVISKDISAIHRLGKPNSRYPTRVIVRFINRKIVDLCFSRKGQLSTLKNTLKMNLRFYESLASLNQEALKISEKLEKDGLINKFYLRNGFVKIVVNENDNPLRIDHPQVLREMFDIQASAS